MTQLRQLTLLLMGGTDSDDQELDELSMQLRSRLLDMEVDAVESVRGPEVAHGAKGVDPLTLGAMVVTLSTSAIPPVIDMVKTWIENRPLRRVTATIGDSSITLDKASQAEQDALVAAFLEKVR